ncbi:unannotated protein [freshwater metagenome]|uniref:Unannotated protein n=1 Tax=freshwater metagenome TaxID=449393 RepID=A0A6J6X8I4_9ZZZZ
MSTVELLLRGAVDLVKHGGLVGRQGPLTVVSEHAGAHGVVTKQVVVTYVEEWSVDDLKTIGSAGHQNTRKDVVEVIAGVLGNGHATSQHWHFDGGGKVGGAKDDGLQARRGGTDFVNIYQATSGFNLSFDTDVANGKTGVLFDLRQEQVHSNYFGR